MMPLLKELEQNPEEKMDGLQYYLDESARLRRLQEMAPEDQQPLISYLLSVLEQLENQH